MLNKGIQAQSSDIQSWGNMYEMIPTIAHIWKLLIVSNRSTNEFKAKAITWQASVYKVKIIQILTAFPGLNTETRCIQAFKLRNKDLLNFARLKMSLFEVSNTYKIQ